MGFEILSLIFGAAIGWLTNWIFERRAVKAAKAEAAEKQERNRKLETEIERLKEQLSKVSQNVLSGAREHLDTGNAAVSCEALEDELYAAARRCLSPDGTVAVSKLKGLFLGQAGYCTIDGCLESLRAQGKIGFVEKNLVELL
ncbi:MAG: hypothetical protein LBI64_05475 [Coriobacteriales bacterium]|nr:hypothetical protein [Coriobacteriales bacterium]